MSKLWDVMKRTVKRCNSPKYERLCNLTKDEVDLWHGLTGLCSETGEIADAIKKGLIYGQTIDKQNIVEELGDIFFYAEMIMKTLDIPIELVIECNDAKLKKRYPEGFTEELAKERLDKNGQAD